MNPLRQLDNFMPVALTLQNQIRGLERQLQNRDKQIVAAMDALESIAMNKTNNASVVAHEAIVQMRQIFEEVVDAKRSNIIKSGHEKHNR